MATQKNKSDENDRITPATRVSIPLSVMVPFLVSIVVLISGGVTWINAVNTMLEPLPRRLESQSRRLDQMAAIQHDLCDQSNIIARFTVPDEFRTDDVDCDSIPRIRGEQ